MTYLKRLPRNAETDALNETISADLIDITITGARISENIYFCEGEESQSITFIFDTNMGLGILQFSLFDDVVSQFRLLNPKTTPYQKTYNILNLRLAMTEGEDEKVSILSNELAQKGEINNLYYLGCLRKLFEKNPQMVELFYHLCERNQKDPYKVWSQLYLQAKGH